MARQNGAQREGLRARPAVLPEAIPDKLCFRIGEVAQICAVPSYVLRFWEREFPQLRPAKGGTGQRLYRRRDVEMALRVRRLLYEEGYTIPGARQWLRDSGRAGANRAEEVVTGEATTDVRLREMRADLEEIAQMLARGERRRTARTSEPQRHAVRRSAAMDVAMPLFDVLEGSGPGDLVEGNDGDER